MHHLETKIPPPVVMVIFGLIMWVITQFTTSFTIAATLQWSLVTALFLSGVFFGTAGLVSLNRAKTTINPLKPDSASSLVSSGIFSRTRKPMYIALTMALCSLVVYLASAWTFIAVIAFVFHITRFQIQPEERAMMKLFGEEFTAYKNRVRRWV